MQPWARAEHKVDKTGVVIAGHQIITTAEGLNDQTLIRLQKQGGGLYSLGRVVWIDYQSNLAALTTDEARFWDGVQPAELADPVPITGDVRILRWNGDRLENRPGDIERMTVDNSALSFVSVPALKVDSTISGAGLGRGGDAGQPAARPRQRPGQRRGHGRARPRSFPPSSTRASTATSPASATSTSPGSRWRIRSRSST